MTTPETKVTLEPKMKGRFSVYDTPDGGIHIVYQDDSSEESKHLEVPGQVLRMAMMLENGSMSPAKMIKSLMGGGK